MSLPPKLAGIYQLRNVRTGEIYIGATNNLRARCSGHFSLMRAGLSAVKIQQSYNQHGPNSIAFEVLLICVPANLSFYEDKAFKILQPTLNCERSSIEYEVWRNPGAEWKPNENMKRAGRRLGNGKPSPRRYCPSCEASVTSTDIEAGACTQCNRELKG